MKLKCDRIRKKYVSRLRNYILWTITGKHLETGETSFYLWFDRMDDAFNGACRILPFRKDILKDLLVDLSKCARGIIDWDSEEPLAFDDLGVSITIHSLIRS